MLTDIDLKALAEVYDTEPTFVSAYLNMMCGDYRDFLRRRERDCKKALRGKLLRTFERNMEKVHRYLDSASPECKALVVFCSAAKDLSKAYELTMPLENQLVVDTSPYLRQLAMLVEEYEPLGIIVLNHNSARIIVAQAPGFTETQQLKASILSRQKKGGWSQMRYQRIRAGEIKGFFKEVAENAEVVLDEGVRRVILAGPKEAKRQFDEYLSKPLRAKLIGSLDVDIQASEGTLLEMSYQLFFSKERCEERALITQLREAIARDEPVVYGVKATLDAVRSGKADLVLINEDIKVRGWKCEHCKAIGIGVGTACRACGNAVTTVDVIEELVELAELTATQLEFVEPNESLAELGGTGAFLRYR